MKDLMIKKVIIEKEASGHALTDQILRRIPDIPVQTIEETESKASPDETDMGKETLHLLSYKGEFLKPCPGTREYICCGYQILNVATNCPLDCSYCILQSYFNQPYLKTFVNLEQGVEQVLKVIDSSPDLVFRVGTGEFTDSLAIDPITRWSDWLLPLFSKRKNAVLELKTKTDNIRGLLNSKFRDRIIVSWSLNSPLITAREEHRAVSLKKRLEAARQCQSEGFVLGFHFDPLIPHPKWKEEYTKTLELLDKYIDPKGIIWISLGSLRFMPGLKPIIRRRHPNTCVLDGEFIIGLDGKIRYFKPIRMELYSYMRRNLEKWHPDSGLYLCMESHDVWQKSMGWSPENSNGLRRYLDRRVVEIFG
ncbi:MAG: DNA photolyase [Deltaproteobacteria bacterium]|nr:DNA photolyase [Deltaproteobacteria bacterium]